MKSIEEFIEDFRTREYGHIPCEQDESEEIIRHLFHSGYCYYFALMLQAAYPGGEVCLAYPYGHIVYVYEGKPYDIEGESIIDTDEFIPISFLGDNINDFKHNGTDTKASKERIEEIHENWLRSKE